MKKMRTLLGITLLTSLATGVVAVGRPQEDRPTPVPSTIEGIQPLPEPFEVQPSQRVRVEAQPPAVEGGGATADGFMRQNQQIAAQRLAELTERCERLRQELEAAEQERAKWQAINDAMASVPERFGQIGATPAPETHPTGALLPSLAEPPLELPPGNPFEVAPRQE